MIKMIVVDIDGTIYNKRKINDIDKKAIADAQANGLLFTIATGRSVRNIQPITKELALENFDVPIIGHNGCQLYKFHKNGTFEIIYDCNFEKAEADQLFALARQHKVHIYAYSCNPDIAYLTNASNPMFVPFAIASKRKSYTYNEKTFHLSPVSKLIVFGKKAKMIAFRKDVVALGFPTFSFSQTTNARQNIEVVPKGVNKAKGIEFVAKQFNIKPEEIMFFGDGENDVDALKWVGVGVAMGNAKPEVQKHANKVTDTVFNAGVGQEINKVLKLHKKHNQK
ncbi:Cof-type HAD-IIB family hydrolase [Williamsoniiplasma lucivorax]|uniref:HAD superfamily hydrolase n=1 Tax=Williamsoniiplasma lucivorax TaxID=209274 RepID=A0A2S5RAC3_9MOLU|nr:Cof-type HAD-IIB family hydrolase [Williamsoniiplasma lucivorax]PPE04142.1 HAD superfamily hydrolase [Williamsoniiplasma lucivorax]